MPVLIDRRGFLVSTVAAGLATAARLPAQTPSSIRMALLSDTHISADPNDQFRGFFPHQNLRKAVSAVHSDSFDLLLVNGDMARREGRPEDYVPFTEMLSPLLDSMPMVATLGNHDDRKNARSALTKRAGELQPVEQKLVSTLDTGPFRLVFLDSLMVTNISAGQLGHSQREWLPRYLDAQGNKPMLVFVHHNPDPDSDGALVDAEQLLSILKPRRAVKALFFGHTHVYKYEQQQNLHLVNLPAVGYNFADGNPVGWVEGAFTAAGATLTLHAIAGETSGDGKVTQLTWRS